MNDSGKVSVSEVRQNDSAFRMNTSSRKVLREGVGLEEDNVLEHKGFWDGANLRLGAIDTTNLNRRRGERKKDIQKSSKTIQIMHEHVICKRNCIMGSA